MSPRQENLLKSSLTPYLRSRRSSLDDQLPPRDLGFLFLRYGYGQHSLS
jgi:hypothetical protein